MTDMVTGRVRSVQVPDAPDGLVRIFPLLVPRMKSPAAWSREGPLPMLGMATRVAALRSSLAVMTAFSGVPKTQVPVPGLAPGLKAASRML
jgi:hypothetical protein